MVRTLNIDKAFGRILRRTRESKGMTQEQLAFESGLHRTYVSLIERGLRSPSLKTIRRLADALDVRITSLIKDLEKQVDAAHAGA